MPHSITLHSLDIGYAARRRTRRAVCSGLSATAPAGTLTCLIGRNGTGKSTLLRTVARLQPPLGGTVTIGTRDAASYTRGELARTLGIVLTARPDASALTVEQLVALGRAPYTGFWGVMSDADRDAVSRAMRYVGIESMARRRVCSLSDGECQKAMIAKALAQQTPVILLDEPTAFLDFPGKIDLLLTLGRLAHDGGKTVLLSTHDIETALKTADRLWLIEPGGITQGTPQQLADSGAIDRYIGRPDVALDRKDMNLKINRQ